MWGRNAAHVAVLSLILGFLGSAPLVAEQDDPRLDELFAQLKTTDNKNEITGLTTEIWSIWRHSDEPAVNWMMHESHRFMKQGILDSALGGFELIVKVAPEFAEGWHKRATVHFLMGNYPDSIKDIKKTIALEPRHFGAYAGLGLIYLNMGQEEAALKALEKALEINPHLSGTRMKVEELRQKLNGKKI